MIKLIICNRCIIDNIAYPDIKLNNKGICNVCDVFDGLNKSINQLTEVEKNLKLQEIVQEIKNKKKGKYDCILGLSGGVDSSYLAILAKQWGLNPLLLHVDNGWNSELAVNNIEQLIDYSGFDLFTYVVNWEELRDLDIAFLKASVVDIDLPNEMPFLAILYKIAKQYGLKHIITGHNNETEGWMPDNVTHYKLDTINLRAIHRRFGKVKLKTYPLIGPLKEFYYEKILGIHYVFPLNYMAYDKNKAKMTLIEKIGWRDYGDKHFENIFTRFYQACILPAKFKIDKRKFHFSNLICSGQMTRDEALSLIKEPPYKDLQLFNDDMDFFLKKLKLSEKEFRDMLQTPPKKHTEYPSYIIYYNSLKPIYKFFKKMITKSK